MLMDQLKAQKNVIVALGEKYGARRIRVFGSVARGEERADSDVDFVVEFDRGYDLFAQRLAPGATVVRAAGAAGRSVAGA